MKGELIGALAAPDCASCQSPCGRTDDYDLKELQISAPPLFTAKFLLWQSLCAVGSLLFRLVPDAGAKESGLKSEALRFLYDGLFMLGYAFEAEQLTPFLETAGNLAQKLLPLLAE